MTKKTGDKISIFFHSHLLFLILQIQNHGLHSTPSYPLLSQIQPLPRNPSQNPSTQAPPQLPQNPNVTSAKEEHPVEVIGRIRDYPDGKEKPLSILQVSHESHSVRVKTESGYRDFTLDEVSLSEEEDVALFYKKFVESRIKSVKLGEKCTVMMYGPTGSGKSYTMFGCVNQPGIVYRSLKDILGDEEEGSGNFVQVTILEIYNEEIYDLLPNSGTGGIGFGWSKGGSDSKEASKENAGKFITTLKLRKDASLADARKHIEIHFGADNTPFAFLVLGVCHPFPLAKEAVELALL